MKCSTAIEHKNTICWISKDDFPFCGKPKRNKEKRFSKLLGSGVIICYCLRRAKKRQQSKPITRTRRRTRSYIGLLLSFYKRRVVVCDMGIQASKAGSNVGKQGIGVLEEVWECPALPVRPLEARGSLKKFSV